MRKMLLAWSSPLALLVCVARVHAAPPSAVGPRATLQPARVGALQQIAGVLDYIGGDYRAAVDATGKVIDEGEYVEQQSLAKEADAIAAQHGLSSEDPLRCALAELAKALERRALPAEIGTRCKQTRALIETRYGVSLAPSEVPSRESAAQLYRAQACHTCHGDDGSANTALAKTLDPQPANFLDAERVASVSAHRAYHAITHGVAGTGMAGFKQLTNAQRWSLSFYVLALRHLHADTLRGKRAFVEAGAPAPDEARGLSSLSEEELIARLQVITNTEARDAALGYLRAEAPFAGRDAARSLFLAFQKLDRGVAAYAKGDLASARELLISAYLDGFEPHEAGLRAKDGALVSQIESAMLGLRDAAGKPDNASAVEARAKQARALLARAEAHNQGESAAFAAALTITLREGLEIVLLVAALLALVRKRGQPQLAKHVHLGWVLSIPAGLATYWLAGSLLGGMQRELAEGAAALLAAVVLLGVTHWLLGQVGAKQWVGFLARQIGDAATRGSSRRAALGVLALSFLAAYRESFEIVLFFQALTLDAAGQTHRVWLGAATGLGLLSLIAVALLRIGARLKPAPFMLASSIFLALLSLVLVGKGIRALQEAGVIAISTLEAWELPTLGVHATRQGLLAQGLLLVLLCASALWPWLNARRQARDATVAAE
jgi:high-affinity iron transporter